MPFTSITLTNNVIFPNNQLIFRSITKLSILQSYQSKINKYIDMLNNLRSYLVILLAFALLHKRFSSILQDTRSFVDVLSTSKL